MVLTESLDRLSRDQEHIARFHKEAKFADVRIVTLAEGEISELHVGLKGTMGALYLKDLADKTRRGLEGRVRQGRSGGGLCYGYRVIRGAADPSGEHGLDPLGHGPDVVARSHRCQRPEQQAETERLVLRQDQRLFPPSARAELQSGGRKQLQHPMLNQAEVAAPEASQ